MVGIGTTSPTRQLDVQGTTGSIVVAQFSSQSAAALVDIYTGSSASDSGIRFNNPASSYNMVMGYDGTAKVFRLGHGSGALSSGSSDLTIDLNYRLGIGTSTAASLAKLTIATSTNSQIALSDGLGSSIWSMRAVGGPFYIATTSPTTYATGTNPVMFMDDVVGSVGFGTTTPVVDTNPSRFLTVDGGQYTNAEISVGRYQTNGFVGGFNFFNGANTGTDKRIAGVWAGLDGAVNSGKLYFYTYSSGGAVNPMIIDSSSRIMMGTTTASGSSKLTASNSAAPQISLTDASLTSDQWAFRNAGGTLYIATSSAATYATSTAPAVLTLKNSGNIGMGTTSPWAKFSIHANNGETNDTLFAIASSTAAATTTLFTINNSGRVGIGTTPSTGYLLTVSSIYTSSSGSIDAGFIRDAGGTSYFLDPAGDSTVNSLTNRSAAFAKVVGIGTTSSAFSAMLDIASSTYPQLSLTDPNGGTDAKHLIMRYVGGNLYIGTSTDAMSATSTDMTFQPTTGYLGLGTTSPWRTLSVTGTVAMSGLTTLGSTGDAICLTAGKEINVNTGATSCTVSSLRFKHDVVDIDRGLDLVKQLHPVSYAYNGTTNRRLGFIAEEVNAIEPRLVFYEEDGTTPRGVRYEDVTPVLVKSVQELDDRLSILEGATSTATSTSGYLGTAIKNSLASFGVFLSDAMTHISNLTVDTLTVGSKEKPTGVTLFDKNTGNPYCLYIQDGLTTTTSGSCESLPTSTSTVTYTTSSSTSSSTTPSVDMSLSSTTPVIDLSATTTSTTSTAPLSIVDLTATSTATSTP
jgi:hypothetical protein